MKFGGSNMGNMSSMIKQAQKMQQEMQKIQADLANEKVEGTAGGGMVTATVNGQGDLLGVKISPEVVNPSEIDVLEDLVLAAVSEASRKAKELMQSRMGRLTGGMNLPF